MAFIYPQVSISKDIFVQRIYLMENADIKECFVNILSHAFYFFYEVLQRKQANRMHDWAAQTWWHSEDKPKKTVLDHAAKLTLQMPNWFPMRLRRHWVGSIRRFKVIPAWMHQQGSCVTVSAYPKSSSMKTKLNDTQRCKHLMVFFSFL